MQKIPIWAPYLQKIEYNSRKKIAKIAYQGGEVEAPINHISHVMIYGETDKSKLDDVAEIVEHGVPVIYHRRNVSAPVWMMRGMRPDPNDLVRKQILARDNEHKRKHVARKLLLAKWESQKWLVGGWPHLLKPKMTLAQMRQVEALNASFYWRAFFEKIDMPDDTRRGDNEVNGLLDSVSKFVAGIVLRYVVYHHLSPHHGFLHEPSSYPALVYDLMEPSRGYFEQVVMETILEVGVGHDRIMAECINKIKEKLNDRTYTNATRQIVTYHELVHGSVLAIRAYLIGESQQLVLPTADKPNGGRPRKVGFKLYGRSAGKTDFWDEANRYARAGTSGAKKRGSDRQQTSFTF